ncbi:unnamed protein product [Brassicogethes aeneus]|uniref:MADF domain-containing protein n=1 Tax=Brassicogethes aeneus TaxID=1431903 RepID=A0A9P0B1I4_BRAAE|nr:unnamed protein product [Brassicogethes aeneus]
MTKEIIQFVKKYPILYDSTLDEYKDLPKRNLAWQIIGEELNEDGESLKKKWKNIRDCYGKYLRSIENPKSIKRTYKNWRYAKEMEFFKPFLEPTLNLNNNEEKIIQDESDNYVQEQILDKKYSIDFSTFDYIDILFLGYSATIKNLTPEREVQAKIKIAKLIAEEEIKSIQEKEDTASFLICPNVVIKEEL